MATFGLVHGAYHGAWCWSRLRAELEGRGHRVLTLDLPCEDPQASASEYADAAIEAFADAGDDLVVVRHSLAGLTIPLVAVRRPVSRLVYLCAMLPRPGRTHDDVLGEEPDMAGPRPDEPTTYTDRPGATHWYPKAAAGMFFSDCSTDVASWAASRLGGQHWKITAEVSPLAAWPDTPRSVVIGSEDLVINPAWSRRVAPAVLGVTAIELDCGHSPFLSIPAVLANVLIGAH